MNTLEHRLTSGLHAAVDEWSPVFDPSRLVPSDHRRRHVAPYAIAGGAVAAGVAAAFVAGGMFGNSGSGAPLVLQATPAASASPGTTGNVNDPVVVSAADDGRTVDVRLGQEVRIKPTPDSSCGSNMVAIKMAVDYDGAGLAGARIEDESPADMSSEGAYAFQPKRTGVYKLAIYIGKCRPGSTMVEATSPSWAVQLRVTD